MVYEKLYDVLFDRLIDGKCEPHIDCDDLLPSKSGIDFHKLAKSENVKVKKSKSQKVQTQYAIEAFCENFPYFVTFFKNCRFKADIAINHAVRS